MPTDSPDPRITRRVTSEGQAHPPIAVLAGGVGGAKMAHGLSLAADPVHITVIVNTADDFDHLGLKICPDLDTVMYTLGGIANPVTGWGIAGDTQHVLFGIRAFGGPDWFQIGDRDFATHITRTASLAAERSLTEVTSQLCAELGIRATILPMSDDQIETQIHTPDGVLAFQDYFVRRRQQDEVIGVAFHGAPSARPQVQALNAIAEAGVVVLSPSNPLVSIGPMLAVPGYEEALRSTEAVKVAISPIISGKALKGPADRMLTSLGYESSALGVARMYAGLIDGFVIDHADRALSPQIEALGMEVLETEAIMHSEQDRSRLAGEVLQFAETIRGRAAVVR